MLEHHLVAHCSPTLAGLKSANIFNYSFTSIKLLNKELELCRTQLCPKGVSIRLLRCSGETALIYVYRSRRVQRELKEQGVFDFLSGYGYETDCLETCLRLLSRRISSHTEFPHEIGLFLGYPLTDVKGFIENKGKNSRCSGCWKVYCNECEAQKLFARFKKCRKVYCGNITAPSSSYLLNFQLFHIFISPDNPVPSEFFGVIQHNIRNFQVK